MKKLIPLVAVLVLFATCRKGEQPIQLPKFSMVAIQARQWYLSQTKGLNEDSLAWGGAKIEKLNDTITDVTVDFKEGTKLAGWTRGDKTLFIYKYNGEFHGNIIIAFTNTNSRLYKYNDQRFSGIIITCSVDGTPLLSRKVDKGQIVSRSNVYIALSTIKTKLSLDKIHSAGTITPNGYSTGGCMNMVLSDDNGNSITVYSTCDLGGYAFPIPYGPGSNTFTNYVFSGPGSSYSGSGPAPGSGMGFGSDPYTTGLAQLAPVNATPPPIKNNIIKPCLKILLSSVLGNPKLVMSSLVNNSYGTPGGHLFLTVDDSKDYYYAGASGATEPNRGTSTNGKITYWYATVHVNPVIASTCSQEYTVETLLHELGHSYLFGLRQKAYGDNAVATNYVKTLAKDMKTLYPNMTDDTANALAWGGLYDQASGLQFKQYDPVTYAKYLQINNQHKQGTTGTPPCTDGPPQYIVVGH